MSFGFRLSVVIAHGCLGSDENRVELELADPIGCVTLRPSPPGASFRDAEGLIFTGSGYGGLEAAARAGRALKNAVRLAGMDIRKAIDVGKDVVRSSFSQEFVDLVAQHGFLPLTNVHGLQVYEEIGTPRVLSMQGYGTVTAPFESFIGALESRAPEAANMSDKRALACDLFAQSRFELSQRSQLLTLCTALEVLAERRDRAGRAAELVEEFRRAIIKARTESTDADEWAQLTSLLSGVTDLRKESISAAVRHLSASVPSGEAGGLDPAELARKGYSARSELIHSGATAQDLSALSSLWDVVKWLVEEARPEDAS